MKHCDVVIRLEKEGKEKENLLSDLCFCSGQFMFVCVTYDVWPLANTTSGLI